MNSTKKIDSKENKWLKPLITGAILGALLPFSLNILYQNYQDKKLVTHMANNLSYEINQNQAILSTLPETLNNIGDFRKPNRAILLNTLIIFLDFYNLYLSQGKLNLFNQQISNNIVRYYEHLSGLKYEIEGLGNMLNAYYSEPPKASIKNINNQIVLIRNRTATIQSEGDNIGNEIKNKLLLK